ncbi:MAG: hypothetical protein NT013_07565 [Planctomycetia bacterium]|nr:hypothetical protein [Planctomycetia bacterium]
MSAMKPFWKVVGVQLIALTVLYAGCYLAMVQRRVCFSITSYGTHGCFAFTYPEYGRGGEATEWFFMPAFWIDYRIRAKYWADTTEDDAAPSPQSSSIVP